MRQRILVVAAVGGLLALLLTGTSHAIAPSDADAIVAHRGDGSGLGDNVINDDGTDQTLTIKAKQRHAAEFDVWIWNDGGLSDTFFAKGCHSTRRFKVRYEVQEVGVFVDVSDTVRSAPGYETVTMGGGAPQNAELFHLDITPTGKAPDGKVFVCRTTGSPQDGEGASDTVGSRVKVT